MADDRHELIIVRRHEEEEHEHHSSAWKVAHADFMTAMMAFFLIMWLINVTDDEVRKGISQYFNPIHLSEGSTEMKGLNAPDTKGAKSGAKVGHSEQPSSPAMINALVLSQGNPDPASVAEAEKALAEAAAAAAEAAGAGAAPQPTAEGPGSAVVVVLPDPNGAASKPTIAPAAGVAEIAALDGSAAPATDAGERAAFQDPYAVLAKLAAAYTTTHPMSVDTVAGDDRQPGVAGGEVDRDPFDPVYWQLTPQPAASAENPGPAGSTTAVPLDALPDALAPLADTAASDPTNTKPAPAEAVPASSPDANATPPPPAEVAKAVAAAAPSSVKIDPATIATSQSLEAEIARSVEPLATEASPQISVKATAEGVLINLTDDAAFSMFAVGSAIPDPKVVVLMARIAGVLNAEKGDVIIRGFTDGRPFHSDAYDNWRLSAARAHMAYYMLTRGGLDEKRVVAIEGHADRALKNAADPLAAENRRIEILVKQDSG
jgi:chemotaxis protein MotB